MADRRIDDLVLEVVGAHQISCVMDAALVDEVVSALERIPELEARVRDETGRAGLLALRVRQVLDSIVLASLDGRTARVDSFCLDQLRAALAGVPAEGGQP